MEDLDNLISVKDEIVNKIEKFEYALKGKLYKERKKSQKELDKKEEEIERVREEIERLQGEGSNKGIHTECCQYVVSGVHDLFDRWNKSVPERNTLEVRAQSKEMFVTSTLSPGLTSEPTERVQRQECPKPEDETSQKPSQAIIRKRQISEEDSTEVVRKRTRRSPRLAKDEDQKVK